MQRRFSKKIYLYPRGEDSQICWYILDFLQKQGLVVDFGYVDDANEQTSLLSLRDAILSQGELWIVHQDSSLASVLFENTKILPQEFVQKSVFDGIKRLQEFFYQVLREDGGSKGDKSNQKARDEGMSLDAILNPNHPLYGLINYAYYFLFYFFLSLSSSHPLVQQLKKYALLASAHFKKQFSLPPKSVGIYVSSFAHNKHLGEIASYLGVNVFLVCASAKELDELDPNKQDRALILPLQHHAIIYFLNIFDYYVVSYNIGPRPSWSGKWIVLAHAYVDPLSVFIHRKRPLDEAWFNRRMGINGYKILPNASSYAIYQKAFKQKGAHDELVCGGYPSLDFNLKHYEALKPLAGGGIA